MAVSWIRAGEEQQFGEGVRWVALERQRVVIARLNGQLFAFDARCPHAGGPMEHAEIDGTVVSCPLHAWRFDLENGGVELHGYRSLTMRDVKVEGGDIYVALPASRTKA